MKDNKEMAMGKRTEKEQEEHPSCIATFRAATELFIERCSRGGYKFPKLTEAPGVYINSAELSKLTVEDRKQLVLLMPHEKSPQTVGIIYETIPILRDPDKVFEILDGRGIVYEKVTTLVTDYTIAYRDGQIFLLSSSECPHCKELKSRTEINEGIKKGDIILLEDEHDPFKQKLEVDLGILELPEWVVYSSVCGFITKRQWEEIKKGDEIKQEEMRGLDISIVVNPDLRDMLGDLLRGYIQDGTVKLIDISEIPKKYKNIEVPSGYIDGKLYPVEITDDSIIVKYKEGIVFSINE